MKRVIIVIAIICISTICFADNSERIAQLQQEGQELSARLQEYQQVINNIQVEIIRKAAQIDELQRLDKEDEETKEGDSNGGE